MTINLCSTAVQLLQNYLDQPNENGHLESFIQHSSACQTCSLDSSTILETLRIEAVDTITCQACEERLPEYMQAESEGVEGEAGWFAVTLHLKTCPHCMSEYESLRELIPLSTDDSSLVSILFPTPDLSFLKQGKPSHPRAAADFWYLNDLGRLVVNFSAELLASLELRPVALQGLKSGPSRLLYEIDVSDAFEDFDVLIATEADQQDAGLCTIVVNVTSLDLEWPELAGSQVMLRRRNRESVTQETDPYGEAVFPKIEQSDLPHLAIEIKPGPAVN